MYVLYWSKIQIKYCTLQYIAEMDFFGSKKKPKRKSRTKFCVVPQLRAYWQKNIPSAKQLASRKNSNRDVEGSLLQEWLAGKKSTSSASLQCPH